MTWWARWVDSVSAREDATSLALFRFAMGTGVLLTIGTTWAAGLVPVIWIDAAHGGMRVLGAGPWLVNLLGGPTPTVVWSLVMVSMLSGLSLAVGFGGRISAVVALLSTNALVTLNGHAGGSYDQLLSNGLWLCVLAGGGATLSVDAWRRTGQWWPEAQVLAFPRWLAALQLIIMYCMTGLQKVSAYWVPGGDASALYYIMQQPSWQRIDMSWVAWVYPLTQLSTLVTWFWEVFSPVWLLALWWSTPRADGAPRGGIAAFATRWGVRWAFFVVGIAMHIIIYATMNVGPFSYLSLGFYAVMVHPAEWRQLAAWLQEQRATLWERSASG